MKRTKILNGVEAAYTFHGGCKRLLQTVQDENLRSRTIPSFAHLLPGSVASRL